MRFVGVMSAAIVVLFLQSCAGGSGTKVSGGAERVESCVKAAERPDESAISLCDMALGTVGLSKDLQARALAARGVAYSNKRNYPAAVADFTRALALRSNAETYHNRARPTP